MLAQEIAAVEAPSEISCWPLFSIGHPSTQPSSAAGLDSPHGCPNAAAEALHPGRTFLGRLGRPAATPPFLLRSLQVMVTNVTSLLKTVKAVEDEATRGTRALEATIEYIKQELTVVPPPTPAPQSLAKLRFTGRGGLCSSAKHRFLTFPSRLGTGHNPPILLASCSEFLGEPQDLLPF